MPRLHRRVLVTIGSVLVVAGFAVVPAAVAATDSPSPSPEAGGGLVVEGDPAGGIGRVDRSGKRLKEFVVLRQKLARVVVRARFKH